MKKIPLTQGMCALADDEDYEYLNQWKWYAAKQHNGYYAFRSDYSTGKVKTIRMHKEILTEEKDIDHKDGNGLNNQKYNIRYCTHPQNHQNRKHHKNCSSIYKGVSLCFSKWRAQIMFDGKVKHLGLFSEEKEAALAYDKKAMEVFGVFARVNFSPMEE